MKFSVIIPVYNVAPFLKECIESVITAASKADVEVICIDDGSTDGSGKVLSVLASKYAGHIVVLHQNNVGVSAARNRGLDEAKGDYVWFVDGDDVIAPYSFELLEKIVNEYKCPDIVRFEIEKYEVAPTFKTATMSPSFYDLGDKNDLRLTYFRYAQWMLGSSALYLRSRYANERFEGMANCEDSVWGRRALYRARSFVYLPQVLYGYRQRPGSANNVWTFRRWRDYCRAGWIMTMEGLLVSGIRRLVLIDGMRHAWQALCYLKKLLIAHR